MELYNAGSVSGGGGKITQKVADRFRLNFLVASHWEEEATHNF